MDWDSFTQIVDQLYKFIAVTDNLIIVALICLGIILKNIEKFPNAHIPDVIFGVGLLASGYLIKPIAVGILKGVVYSAIAMLIYEVILKRIIKYLQSKTGDSNENIIK